MEKPAQILELEKILGFKLTETKDIDDILDWKRSKIYLLNENQDIIALNLHYCNIFDTSILPPLPSLVTLDLAFNELSHISLEFFNHFPELDHFKLYNNPIKNIPDDIYDKNINTLHDVRNYLEKIAKESIPNNEIKII